MNYKEELLQSASVRDALKHNEDGKYDFWLGRLFDEAYRKQQKFDELKEALKQALKELETENGKTAV